MCGRLVNLDTVARVLADYYHLKTETQLAALDEALSKVPAVSVGGGHGKDHVADPGNMVGDLIGRQTAMRAVNGLIDRFERILRDIRETQVDDSVCGMCEYDGAFVGQSGNWCNECPGFEKDDCFKLSDECRKRWLESVELPSAQPEPIKVSVDREMTEEELKELKKKIADSPVVLLPSAQPEIVRCKDCMHNGSFDTDCPIKWNGKEYCSFAERRTDERFNQ